MGKRAFQLVCGGWNLADFQHDPCPAIISYFSATPSTVFIFSWLMLWSMPATFWESTWTNIALAWPPVPEVLVAMLSAKVRLPVPPSILPSAPPWTPFLVLPSPALSHLSIFPLSYAWNPLLGHDTRSTADPTTAIDTPSTSALAHKGTGSVIFISLIHCLICLRTSVIIIMKERHGYKHFLQSFRL